MMYNFSPGTIVSQIARRSHGAYQDDDLYKQVLYDFLDTVKAAPHECEIRTGQT